MKLLMTASQIRGLPVVTVRGGEDVAEVRDVIYSPEAGRLVGLTLNQRGFLLVGSREVLPADAIHAVGKDAVMVSDEGPTLAAPEVAPDDIARPATDRNVLGNDVLTEGEAASAPLSILFCWSEATARLLGMRSRKLPADPATFRYRSNCPSQAMHS